MITKSIFKKIKDEVKDGFDKTFLHAEKNQKFENDFILFLAHAEYLNEFEGSQVEPAVVDYTLHRERDKGRIRFMLDFLNSNYSFKGKEETLDTENSIFLEFMIYSHIWESKPFLRNIKRLTLIANNKRFPWTVSVPDSGKSQFIESGIAEVLTNCGLDLGITINKAYNRQLRNAFAHSEIVINMHRKEIFLTNYKGEEGQIKSITFEEWTKKFCYSFLINYMLEHHINLVRENLNSQQYKILIKKSNGSFNWGVVNFNKEKNYFS